MFAKTNELQKKNTILFENVAFHQGLQCLLRQMKFQIKKIQYYLEIITCNNEPSQVYSINPERRIHSCIKG